MFELNVKLKFKNLAELNIFKETVFELETHKIDNEDKNLMKKRIFLALNGKSE